MPPEDTADLLLDVTCFAVRLPDGLWEIQCGPLPFADIHAMYRSRNAAARLVEIASAQVRRDIDPEEDAALRAGFIAKAKAEGWIWDAGTQCWRAPEHLRNEENTPHGTTINI